MTKPFPDTFSFSGFQRPQRVECDIYDLEIEGEIPAALNGCFFRCGPEHQYPPLLGDDIYINGDGMVSMLRFQNGYVDYKIRYVRTEKFKLEREARRALFGAYRNPFTDDPSVAGKDRGTANTNVIWHGGKLLALKEQSLPVALNPITLETTGRWDYDGRVTSKTVTAHPKIDPDTGELLFFGANATGETTDDLAFYIADKNGVVTKEVWLKPPYASMMHDFAVTKEHVIFAVMPTTGDLDRMKAGGPIWAWDGSLPMYLGVMPRDGSAEDVRWFKGPARWMYHVMNAYSEDGKVHMDCCVARIQTFPFFPDINGKPYDPELAKSPLTRWTCDLTSSSDEVQERVINPAPGEMPRIDDRLAGKRYRVGFFVYSESGEPQIGLDDDKTTATTWPWRAALGRIDVETGEVVSRWMPPDGVVPQEPVFVPKSADAREGEGYLISVVNLLKEGRSEVAVLDAEKLHEGPIGIARLPIRSAAAIHGNWVPMNELPAGA
ncbi:carotenoid oxygenase family protein [Sphingomonas soli]|uniref:carotenoid oxygenase family protein n=1 Tax=Sphingomonas soli TaxID=266127 RepID=UPI000AC8F3E1|nr:carotenoid oxygenase family protein [Sphingomonas soli]